MLARLLISIVFSIGFGFLTLPLCAQTVLDTVCAGARGVEYRVLETPGSHYDWNVQGGFIRTGNGTASVGIDWGNDTGHFFLEVVETTSDGCLGDTVRAFVWIRDGIHVNIDGPTTICRGDEVTLRASGGGLMIWSTGDRTPSITVKPKVSSKYFVVGYSPSCGTDTAYFNIDVFEKPQAKIEINPPAPKINEYVVFSAAGNGQRNRNVYWSLLNQGQQSVGDEFIQRFTAEGNYKVQLIVIDQNGCSDTTEDQVNILGNVHVHIPNAFTPNSDGLNSTFAPVYDGVTDIRLQIYDRWGALIYRGENDNMGWDGTFKGQPVPIGVYLYYVEAIGTDGEKYVYNGTITLIR